MTLFKNTIAGIAVLALVATSAAHAQSSSDTATANASATIVSAISITKTADLDFGDVVSSASAGTVVLATDGTRSATGGTTLGNAGSAAAAAFSVTGDTDATYSITLPSSAITITDASANTMTVDTFTSNPSGSSTLTGGSDTIAVGATLNVGASQVSGSYTGTFDVTVAYN